MHIPIPDSRTLTRRYMPLTCTYVGKNALVAPAADIPGKIP
jgi:hypothetical protein